MAKPDPVNDLPPDWASNGNFDVGVYSTLLPWLAPNPLAGQPFPWGGLPRNNTANFTSFCNNGLVPQVATDASSFNEWQRRLGVWGVWVAAGSSDPDADAHVMETTSLGYSASVKHCATAGFFGAAFASALLPAGAIISAGMQLELLAGASVAGDLSTTVTTGTVDAIDSTGVVKPGIVDFYSVTVPPTANGQMSWGGRNNLAIGGSGGAARLVAIPVEEAIEGPVVTVNAIEDTGLEISASLNINDVIYIKLEFESQNTSALNNINVRIEVDGAPVGGTNPRRPVAANVDIGISRVVKFTATATAVYAIKGRHGAGAGTTTSSNLRLMIRQANDFA